MITIDCNPGAFLAAGIVSLKSAQVLAVIGRAGISGVTVKDIVTGSKMIGSTVHHCALLLMRQGLVKKCGIDSKQGTPHRYAITPEGQAVLNAALMAVKYPDRLQSPLSLDS